MDHTTRENTTISGDIADWNRIADAYSAIIGTPEDRTARQLRGVLWESLGELQGRTVLDVGCGHGWLTAAMASAGAEVVGIDGSPALLARARTECPEAVLVEHDLAYGLPKLPHRFDRIVANMVVMDLPDVVPLFASVRHALKPNGRFIVTLPHPCFFHSDCDRDTQTGRLYRRITGYLQPEVWRIDTFGGHNHYHRSLTYYVDRLRANHMAVTRLYEPAHIPAATVQPEDHAFFTEIPIFVLIEAVALPPQP